MTIKNLSIALDWTANTNHTGFFIAKKLGFYTDLGIELTIITPDKDNYASTPAKKLSLSQVDFAIAPFESVISLNTKVDPVKAIAIATILQKDISTIACLTDKGIKSPKDLDHKIYASYKARYEDDIVKQMIINDGGKGEIEIIFPEKLGIWDTILNNSADATWIFNNWEGVEAEQNGINLTKFSLADYQIPYGYSPVILSVQSKIEENKSIFKSFLNATKKGFQFAIEQPEKASEILSEYVIEKDLQKIDLLKSQLFINPHYGKADNWGKMNKERVQLFIDWLVKQGLETPAIKNMNLFTNELLED